MGFVGNYALCGLSPQTDGMPVILKKNAFPLGKTFSKNGLLIFFFQHPFKSCWVVAGAVRDVVNEHHIRNQPVNTDVFSGDHQAVATVTQFLVLGNMAGQRKHLQPGKRI